MRRSAWLILVVLSGGVAGPVYADDMENLLHLSIDQLSYVPVVTASGFSETLRNAPAAMVVVSADDIRRRGYTDLSEVLLDLPGFDTTVTNGVYYSTSYQRGYRTPFTQRTLLMINGRVQNDLWIQTADISRQFPFSNIDRIEVLYGPASAIYGANAFSGIINIVTRKPPVSEGSEARAQWETGSYNTQGLDVGVSGRSGQLAYQWSARLFRSDEPGLNDYSKDWGYVGNRWLGDTKVWGPVLDVKSNGHYLGSYADPSRDGGVIGEFQFNGFHLGVNWWKAEEAYGPYYPADKGQSNVDVNRSAGQLYLAHNAFFDNGVNMDSELSYRQSRLWSDWAEADIDSTDPAYSIVSFSHWNSFSEAWQFKQDYRYRLNAMVELNAGVKYEARRLARNYEVCGYFEPESLCPELAEQVPPGGPLGLGPGVVSSTSPSIPFQPVPSAGMAPGDTVDVINRGLYLQTIYDVDAWRIQAGVRVDANNEFGTSTNPRLALINHADQFNTLKLLYGEAYQEPSMAQRFGGWNGRADNPDLVPEKARNLEFIWMLQQDHWLHDMSLYYAYYQHVIKEAAINLGERYVQGFEYRGRYSYSPRWLAQPLTGFLYYTWTRSMSSDSWDAAQQQWIKGESAVGDIAPHKITLGINLPFAERWNFNMRSNYHSATTLYGTNPLRAEGKKLDAYVVVDSALRYSLRNSSVTLKIKNLFNAAYYNSGPEAANSGDAFDQRSSGFDNSLIPQPKRSFYLLWELTI